MKTNHIQIAAGTEVYCHWAGNIVNYTGPYAQMFCFKGCPFFAGTAQGQGIECEFDSGQNDQSIYLDEGMPGAMWLQENSRKFFKPDPNLPVAPDDFEIDEDEG